MDNKFIGRQFGKLKVVSINKDKRRRHYNCLCSCGKMTVVRVDGLENGNTKSCGCLRHETFPNQSHGHSPASGVTRTYQSWANMKNRCRGVASQATNPTYKGVTFVRRWEKYENFLKDMGERPPGYSLERKDPHGNYTPRNCCWIPKGKQSSNTRRTLWVWVNGEKMCCAHAAERLGVNYQKLCQQVRWGNNKYETP